MATTVTTDGGGRGENGNCYIKDCNTQTWNQGREGGREGGMEGRREGGWWWW